MSLINLNQNITNVLPVSGEGNTTYTCPQDKRAILTISMSLSYYKPWTIDYKSRSYTFNIEIKGGDVVTFSESGEGVKVTNFTLSTSFTIGSNTINKQLAFTADTDNASYYSANISYSSIVIPA